MNHGFQLFEERVLISSPFNYLACHCVAFAVAFATKENNNLLGDLNNFKENFS